MAESNIDPQVAQEGSSPAFPTFIKPISPAQNQPKLGATDPDDFEDSSRSTKRRKLDTPQLTAAAAFAEAGQGLPRSISPASTGTSPNPPQQVLGALMGANSNLTSKAPQSVTDNVTDPTTTVSEPLAEVAESIQQASASAADVSAAGDSHAEQTSPTSLSSVGTLESVHGVSGITTTVGSPLPIEQTVGQVVNAMEAGSTSPGEGFKGSSYPTPGLQLPPNEGARRGMSLPQSTSRPGTRSPSSKKHRCPYCATEFTRHHNLKSHLLTHSQEKPYVCSTCQSRFRRLHDLKRHTKLHTGERPHICPKCGRKFARGDALARHNKGPGGCAGRRASMGSYGGDDDAEGDESMEGVMYGEPEVMDDEAGNDKTPRIRRQAPSGDDTVDDAEQASRFPSTYPPIQGRPPGGLAGGGYQPRGTFNPSPSGSGNAVVPPGAPPPFPQVSGSSSGSRTSISNAVYPQNPMTESPKPLSPGQVHRAQLTGAADASLNRNRSPSSSSHYPPGSFGRTSGTSSSLGLPSGPQLPPPNVVNPVDSRYTLSSQGGPAHPPTQPSGPPTHMSGGGPLSSHSNSLSSGHAHSAHGSGETSNMFADKDRLWAYVNSLEQRMNSMQQEIESLKHQLAVATQGTQQQPRM
ncbi:hypothetical protein PV08_04806 [Exophiala spinifera]|uniref:C2H2-type domain-containing protein n=1 Tax=Exophiala spinifera TaxID=91928 RepID=A0A0D1YQW7_9EURO|nr:uncharacterized protein PV08_04806 [Exophiala spinifera]KIW17611.1 hypothetical protein PV08_04806 [Exophiala spinifera]